MIIPINLAAHASKSETKFPPQLAKLGAEEVILIELQGSFEVEGNQSGQLAASLKLGENDSKPTMMVGRNLLEGKIVNLPKPLAVLVKKSTGRKTQRAQSSNSDDAIETEGNFKGDGMCEYDMLAVVKRKVLFSKRPMPIVNMASVATDISVKQ
ncbi:hypothetical protein EW145_g5459 [Phellinidium pouzarii]|uniref:Chromosome transmission fidelity protein 8 n=1 Tax=Phellinidium pouzarii TaxID=167371 RepID=A0A4S4L0G8_9AGAM|nr:hypothetical protein EW145_g5459 [Phellinidium pouzarii]